MCDNYKMPIRKFETLCAVFHRINNLDEGDLKWLYDNGYIYSEFSDYGYKISDKGLLAIGEQIGEEE